MKNIVLLIALISTFIVLTGCDLGLSAGSAADAISNSDPAEGWDWSGGLDAAPVVTPSKIQVRVNEVAHAVISGGTPPYRALGDSAGNPFNLRDRRSRKPIASVNIVKDSIHVTGLSPGGAWLVVGYDSSWPALVDVHVDSARQD